jgi:hypothetical protein
MKSIGIKALAVLAMGAAHSYAIFGIGGQWAPAPGLEVTDSEGDLVTTSAGAISLRQGGVEGLQGFGVKAWVDFLPFIDIEATSNIQMGYYDLDVIRGSTTVPVEAELDVPFVEGKPVFARIVSDLSVLYPFLKLPPLVSLVKLYAGGGITHVLATEVVTSEFAQDAVAGKAPADVDTPEEVAALLADKVVDEGLTSGVGFHLMAGAKAKPPIIPIAVFANVKYHFLSSQPEAVDGNALTLEVGGALAF